MDLTRWVARQLAAYLRATDLSGLGGKSVEACIKAAHQETAFVKLLSLCS